jgi:hypothetical protein
MKYGKCFRCSLRDGIDDFADLVENKQGLREVRLNRVRVDERLKAHARRKFQSRLRLARKKKIKDCFYLL